MKENIHEVNWCKDTAMLFVFPLLTVSKVIDLSLLSYCGLECRLKVLTTIITLLMWVDVSIAC